MMYFGFSLMLLANATGRFNKRFTGYRAMSYSRFAFGIVHTNTVSLVRTFTCLQPCFSPLSLGMQSGILGNDMQMSTVSSFPSCPF
ncbi:hypothetical protein FKM82_028995 [Ascaphus truei]